MTEQSNNQQFQNSSFLQGHNAQYVEQLYARFARIQFASDVSANSPSWRSTAG